MVNVYVDSRWPTHTGIGNVMNELSLRSPLKYNLLDLNVKASIGSPLSPAFISNALLNVSSNGSGRPIYWNPGFVPPLMKFDFSSIVTVHDLTHLHFYSAAHKLYYDYVFKYLYRRCDAICCVSDYTRQEFIEWSGVSGDKVFVVYNGVSKSFIDNTEIRDCGFPYILYPGNHRSYKNIDRLLLAYSASELPKLGIHFSLTGFPNEVLIKSAREYGVEQLVHFLGRLDGADLPKLYKGALFVVFVSLYEGFGLPIVEAMASEVPVITSNVSSMPEVGGDAVLLVDPYSVEEIIFSLNRLCCDTDLRRLLISRGIERVKKFDWDISAGQFWGIVDGVAE